MKVIERIFKKWLRNVIRLDEMLMGLMHGRGTIDAIFIEIDVGKYEMAEKKLYVVFVDFEKAFVRIPKEVIWWASRKRSVIEREVLDIAETYRLLHQCELMVKNRKNMKGK